MTHTAMPDPWIIIPLRSLSGSKSRLRTALSDGERRRLNEELLEHVLGIASAWQGPGHTVVVSPCDEVLQKARAHGAQALRQPTCEGLSEALSETLNAALAHAAQVLRRCEDRNMLILSCDLPLASPADLRQMRALGDSGPAPRAYVLATDRYRQGTNALWVPAGAPADFRFGLRSRQRHARMAQAHGWALRQVYIEGLALDIDTPEDHAAWQATHPGLACAA
jgi:2-phospho-L-lactate guanylyltransferase